MHRSFYFVDKKRSNRPSTKVAVTITLTEEATAYWWHPLFVSLLYHALLLLEGRIYYVRIDEGDHIRSPLQLKLDSIK